MKKRSLCRFISLIAAVLLVMSMLCLSGCDESVLANVYAELKTEVSVTDAFAGQRVMTASFNRQLAVDTFEDLETLTEKVSKATPEQLKCELVDDGVNASYVFTLSFASLDEYKQKVSALIGREPEIVYQNNNQLFTKSFMYEEPFTSTELFGWVNDAVKTLEFSETDLFNPSTFWRENGTSVKVGASNYDFPTGSVSIPETRESVLDKIDISTVLKKNGEFERVIGFCAPTYSVSADDYVKILDFCEKNKPESATVAQSEDENDKIVTVTFKAADENILAQKTTQVLQGVCQSSMSNIQDSSMPFATLKQFDEQLDFSGICSDAPVPFSFKFVSESGVPTPASFQIDGQDISSELEQAEGNSFQYNGSASKLTTSTRFESISTASTVFYNLIMNGSDSFNREIVIMMDMDCDPQALENIKGYYDSKGAEDTIITTLPNGYSVDLENPCVVINISGSGEEVVEAETTLFGGMKERKLGYDKEKSILKVKPSTALTDSYDISSLLSITNVTEYYYTLTSGDSLTGSSRVTAGKVDKDENEIKAGTTVGYVMEDGMANITFNGKYTNSEAIIFIVLLVILGLLLLALAAVLLYRYWQKKNAEKEKPEPEPEMPRIPEPVYEEPVALPAPEPEPVRDFTYVIDEEEDRHEDIQIESFPSSTQENDFGSLYNSMDLSAQEEEPVVEEAPVKVEVRPFVPVYVEPKEEEPEPEPVVLPEPEPVKAPEVPFAESPFEEEYTDEQMIEDLDALGLLDEYVEKTTKVKVKVKKHKSDAE